MAVSRHPVEKHRVRVSISSLFTIVIDVNARNLDFFGIVDVTIDTIVVINEIKIIKQFIVFS